MDDDAVTSGEAPHILDLSGLRCPLPVLYTRRMLGRLAPGRLLDVRCTDPLAGLDIPHLVAETGDVLVEAVGNAHGWRFTVRRRAAPGPEDPTATSPR